ncbi:unnamed protein product [Somion occarium]|uniref:FAD-binding PCMH-type domain-containing protein n=1 Tax=Somion occarium TaxID=3059160 RepID=A0ABP1DX76_9APHY
MHDRTTGAGGRGFQRFRERISTFNGKIKPLSKVLVSPLDAQDVSTIVRFCLKHNLSPSVKAGGYAIAGWSVAGDVVIDMSMMREIDIEAPITTEAGVTWTSLRDKPAGTSKGKDVAGVVQVNAGNIREKSPIAEATRPEAIRTISPKRPREDSPPPPNPQPGQVASSGQIIHPSADDVHLRSYDAASGVVGSFLRGPPLPRVEGDTPREPPKNRPRLHPPGHEADMPVLESRQVSSESATSSSGGSTTGSGSGLSTSGSSAVRSSGTASTSPLGTPGESDSGEKSRSPTNTDPFGYIPGVSATRPSMFGGVEPFNPGLTPSSASVSMFSSAASMFPSIGTWQNSGVTVGAGPVRSYGPSGSPPAVRSSFGFRNPAFSGGFPSTSGAFSLPTSHPVGGVTAADPIHSHAYVTFGAGMRQKEVDLYTAENPLEGINRMTGENEQGLVPYHIPSSAHPVGSSIMLLAGFGFLSRMYGLSIDNVVEVEMVLADGRIVVLDKDTDPDLWWAIRGAGPAFGIATRYKAMAFPIPVVYAGNLIYRFHRATAPSLIKHFRDCIKGCPRELYANVLLTTGPANQDSLIVIQLCYVGPKEKGQEYLQAISSWDGERPLLNEVNEKSYLNQQDSVAQVLRGKRGRQWFMRSSLIHSLPDEVINKTVMKFGDTPIGCTWIFELSGGAIADYEDTCLPKEQREAIWTVAALHQWDMGVDDPRCIESAEEWMEDIIRPVSLGGPFPTFLGRHERPERTMACYGKNWDRLAELKRKYDPHHLFKNNFWPLNKRGEPVEPSYNEPPSP